MTRFAIVLFLTPVAPAGADVAAHYQSLALQGDLSEAATLFESDTLSEDERDLGERFRARFVRRDEPAEPSSASRFVGDVVEAYREYWTRSLMGELGPSAGNEWLSERLRAILAEHDEAIKEWDDPFEAVKEAIEDRGWHHLGGVTLPYRELMLWETEERRRYDVELTDRTQPVDVVFLGDFLVKGWAHWATFGEAYTGGWAASDALYCLRDDYDLDSEKFLVSYLKHEARHFADYELFPELEQIDLEYRGKLTELVYARDSLLHLVRTFARRGEPNAEAPHTYANWAVTRDLSVAGLGEELSGWDDRWNEVEPDTIRRIARELLEKNTRRLEEAGAATTKGVVRPAG